MNKYLIIIITIIAFGLRYSQIDRYLWVDEAISAFNVQKWDIPQKEIIPYYIAKATGSVTRQGLRLPFVLISSLSVLAIYFVVEDKRNALIIAVYVAILPLYSYWGSMARPYCIGAFFAILGYRWPVFYIPAVLTTPLAITAINIWKIKTRWFYYLIIIVAALLYFKSMPLGGADHLNSLEHLIHAKRFWYIPTIGILLNLGDFNLDRLQGLFRISK